LPSLLRMGESAPVTVGRPIADAAAAAS
jgi:hypothetical protein